MMQTGQIARVGGPLLSVENVTCLRGGRILFEGMTLSLHAGEAAILVGPNGVGKSSLMRICAGLLAPQNGRVVRAGAMAMAAESLALDEDLALERALLFWARLDGNGPDAVSAALDAVGLAPIAEAPVRLLSTGQRRRAAIARVIAARAPIWLLDEPGNGLDQAALDALTTIMTGHLAGGGVILAASHQPLGLDGARMVTL